MGVQFAKVPICHAVARLSTMELIWGICRQLFLLLMIFWGLLTGPGSSITVGGPDVAHAVNRKIKVTISLKVFFILFLHLSLNHCAAVIVPL